MAEKKYIEIEAAIELLSQPITMSMCLSTEECHHKIAQQRIDRYLIENIHAADVVERKKGEWAGYPDSFKYEHVYDRDAIVCPFCEESWNIVDNDTERFNFCPNCGADMREES